MSSRKSLLPSKSVSSLFSPDRSPPLYSSPSPLKTQMVRASTDFATETMPRFFLSLALSVVLIYAYLWYTFFGSTTSDDSQCVKEHFVNIREIPFVIGFIVSFVSFSVHDKSHPSTVLFSFVVHFIVSVFVVYLYVLLRGGMCPKTWGSLLIDANIISVIIFIASGLIWHSIHLNRVRPRPSS